MTSMGKTIIRKIDVTEMGRKGGKATAAKRTAKQRREAARRAVQARWKKYREEHPDKKRGK